ncbi:MAG: GldG family protein [Gammaproteobacteria bacterium]|nr:GldG family protein [Gammaproteobacteria bacterium]
MNISPKVKKQLRWQNTLFVIFFLCTIGALAWLSTQYEYAADWTSNDRNTPSEATIELLNKIEEPISITAFVSISNINIKNEIEQLITPYQRYKSDITLTFVDPTKKPDLIREKKIRFEGELIISIEDREERLQVTTEQQLTNAIQRLARTEERWILFLEGHDERSPYGDSTFDMSGWTQIMKSKGFNVKGYNLASNSSIPDNTSLLIIADPQKNLLHGEIQILLNYIEQGGNLLWMIEPEGSQNEEFQGMEELSETLGIELVPGMVVDPNTQLLGINDPRFTIIPEYPKNPITENFTSMTIYPTSKAMEFIANEEWDSEVLLETLPRSWSESDDTVGDIQMDAGQDVAGPLIIGLSLTRGISPTEEEFAAEKSIDESDLADEEQDTSTPEQRVVVIGDNDFASDAYIGEGGNLDFAMNIVNWLVKDDSFISIPTKTRNDYKLELSKTHQIVIGFGFLLVIPVGLLGAGLFIWLKRRNR